jgi:hypothetical protein
VYTGLALTFASIVMIGVRWFPLAVRDSYWRFMISGGSIDGLPLVTVGVLAVGAGLIGWRAARLLRLYAWGCAVLCLGVALIYVAFVTSLDMVSLQAESSFDARTISFGAARASVAAAVAFAIYAVLGWMAWTHSKTAASQQLPIS